MIPGLSGSRGLGELREQLHRRSVVVVAGAGVSLAATGNNPLAAWVGLLRDGIEHCSEFGIPRLSADHAQLLTALTDTGNVDLMLAAATVIEARLGGKTSPEWRRWLASSVGELRAIDWDLPRALQAMGAPLVTTNYDDILRTRDNGRTVPAVTWMRPDQWVDVLTGRQEGVLYLHGWWGDPGSVVLGVRSYEAVLRHEAAQEIQRALGRFNTLLFVGCGTTLSDPNVGPLLEWLGGVYGPNHRHYILVRSEEASEVPASSPLYPIVYGPTHEFLPSFLSDLGRPAAPRLSVARDSVSVLETFSEFTETDEVTVPKMVVVPAGSYHMGCPPQAAETRDDELPQHTVTIDYSFAVSKFPVTFLEWDAFEAASGLRFRPRDYGWGRGKRPVIHVSWNDCQAYLEWLNGLSFIEGTYRLLSESEWEYTARAGQAGLTWWGDFVDVEHANYDSSDIGATTEVDAYQANQFGIHDLLGNVWEWVQDRYHSTYDGAPTDGLAWEVGSDSRRVIRGGCWYYDARYIECSARLAINPDVKFNSVGFRIARTVRQSLNAGSNYVLFSVNSGLAATVTDDGRVCQFASDRSDSQVWTAILLRDDVFMFQSRANGQFLTVLEPAMRNSTRVVTSDRIEGNARQEWRAEPSGDGYILTCSFSGKVLDVDNIAIAEGAPITQFAKHGNANQRWWLRHRLGGS
jgi:formylglycine-generating enzyme required for sulfatase activity